MILELILKICQLKLIYEKESSFSMAVTIHIKNLVCSKYSKVYDNFIFMGDFNVPMSDKAVEDFYFLNNVEGLIKTPTCYKNHENLTCIELIIINRSDYFQHSNVFETGISFHLLIVTQLKMGFQKKLPKVIAYRD